MVNDSGDFVQAYIYINIIPCLKFKIVLHERVIEALLSFTAGIYLVQIVGSKYIQKKVSKITIYFQIVRNMT